MTRKIDADTPVQPEKIENETRREASSRPPRNWPGLEGRSKEDDAEFERDGQKEAPAGVTEAQRELERK